MADILYWVLTVCVAFLLLILGVCWMGSREDGRHNRDDYWDGWNE
jgi:hypothetical protein